MTVDMPTALNVLAHELRGPAGIVLGYLRMLEGNRIQDPAERQRLFGLIREAMDRIVRLGEDTTTLGVWAGRSPMPGHGDERVDVRELITQSLAAAAAGDQLEVRWTMDQAHKISTPDRAALVNALAAIVKGTARESLRQKVIVSITASGSDDAAGMLDIVVAPAAMLHAAEAGPRGPEAQAYDADRGGLGLSLVLGLAVLEAHGAIVWSANGHRGVAGVRLPLEGAERARA